MSVTARFLLPTFALSATLALIGCSGATSTESAARTGALIGGLSDGWGGAATGAIIGGALGYAVDSSEDKKIRAEQARRDQEYRARQQRLEEERLTRMRKSSISENPSTAYRPAQTNPLMGSTWRVISLVDETEATPGFKSWIISFPSNTKATTLIMWDDGRVENFVEAYSVTGDVLVFTGTYQSEPYVTNAKFSVNNGQMVVVTPEARVVLEEVEESI